jgi:CRP-like cAMP-binding protein
MFDSLFAYVTRVVEGLLVKLGLDPTNVTFDAVFNRLMDMAVATITFSNVFFVIGGVFLVATFVVRTIVPMRALTIVSIFFFLTSATLSGSVMYFFMYLLALPANVVRLVQIRNLVKRARSTEQGTMSLDWLKPFMTPRTYQAGDVLFRKGDPASEMFLTVRGRFLVTEIGIEIPPGRILGELGFLSPDNNRTQSVECVESGEVLTISYEKLLEIYFQNPEFGYFFLRLTSDRLLQNHARLARLEQEGRAALAALTTPKPDPRTTKKPLQAMFSTLGTLKAFGWRVKPSEAPAKELSPEEIAAAARRRREAFAIVERYANYTAISGFFPIVNVAAIATVLVRMVKALSRLYNVPFEQNRAYALVIGLMGGVMPTGLAALATSAAVTALPGLNLIGLAVFSVTASAYAREIGGVLVEQFESGATMERAKAAQPVWRRKWGLRGISFTRWARTEREWSRAVYGS